MKEQDAAPLRRIQEQLGEAVAAAELAAEHGKRVAEERLPALHRARGVLAHRTYQRLSGFDHETNCAKPRSVDDTRPA